MESKVLIRAGHHPPGIGGHLPNALALRLAVWPEWVGRLARKRASAGVRRQSSLDPSVEGHGPLTGSGSLGSAGGWEDGWHTATAAPWTTSRANLNIQICSQRTPVSHKVIEKRRRDRINRCLNELGKTVPMALAKQVTWGRPRYGACPGNPPVTFSRDAWTLEKERAFHVGFPPRWPERGVSPTWPSCRPTAAPCSLVLP